MKIFSIFAFLILTVAFLYVGIGGYLSIDLGNAESNYKKIAIDSFRVDDVVYRNIEEYQYQQDKQSFQQIFPYLVAMPERLSLVITALAFGTLGGITKELKKASNSEKVAFPSTIAYSLILGMLSGLFVLGITYVLPTLLVNGNQDIRPETLIFLSLFSGLFSDKFYEWLSQNFDKIYASKNKSNEYENNDNQNT